MTPDVPQNQGKKIIFSNPLCGDLSTLTNSICIFLQVPNGYEKRTDADSGNSYYVNVFTGVRWFSAEDSTGKVYFYEENGNESCWALPNVSQSIQDPGGSESTTSTPEPGAKERENSNESTSKQKDVPTGGLSVKTKTELLEQRRLNLPVSTPDFKIGEF